MPLFGDREARNARIEANIAAVELRLGKLDALLDRAQAGILALESAPSPQAEPDPRVEHLVRDVELAGRMAQEHAGAFEELDRRVVAITLATAEGIERVERAERRVRSTVKRARKELAAEGFESPALEAEDAELRLVDGGGGEDERMRPVREDVEPPGPPPGFAIPGNWTPLEKHLRGA